MTFRLAAPSLTAAAALLAAHPAALLAQPTPADAAMAVMERPGAPPPPRWPPPGHPPPSTPDPDARLAGLRAAGLIREARRNAAAVTFDDVDAGDDPSAIPPADPHCSPQAGGLLHRLWLELARHVADGWSVTAAELACDDLVDEVATDRRKATDPLAFAVGERGSVLATTKCALRDFALSAVEAAGGVGALLGDGPRGGRPPRRRAAGRAP